MSYLGNPPVVNASRLVFDAYATQGQTVITPPGGYTVGQVEVIINGSQLSADDFVATDGSQIVLAQGMALSDTIKIVAYGTFAVANTYTQAQVDTKIATVNSNIALIGPTLKNRIINGDMQVSQRGTTFSSGIGALTYTLDRWTVAAAGAAVSVSAAQDPSSPYTSYMSITGASGNTVVGIRQRIEWLNTKDLAGQNVTVSFYCYNSTSNVTGATVQLDFPTAKDNYTATTSTAAQSINTSATGLQTFTFAVPAAGANGIQICIFAPNLTSGVFVLRGVQLEKGSVATSFDYRPYSTELALCQRYYWKWGGATGYQSGGFAGMTYSGATSFAAVNFPVTMRASPTLASVTGSDYQLLSGNTTYTPSAITINTGATPYGCVIAIASSGATNAGAILWAANTNAALLFSAEL